MFRQFQKGVPEKRVVVTRKGVPVLVRNGRNTVVDGDLQEGSSSLSGRVICSSILGLVLSCKRIDEFLGVQRGHATGAS